MLEAMREFPVLGLRSSYSLGLHCVGVPLCQKADFHLLGLEWVTFDPYKAHKIIWFGPVEANLGGT